MAEMSWSSTHGLKEKSAAIHALAPTGDCSTVRAAHASTVRWDIRAVLRSGLRLLLYGSLLTESNGLHLIPCWRLRIAQLAPSSAGVGARVCRRNEGRHLQAYMHMRSVMERCKRSAYISSSPHSDLNTHCETQTRAIHNLMRFRSAMPQVRG